MTFKTRSSSWLIPLPSSAGFARQQPLNFDGYLFKTLSDQNIYGEQMDYQRRKPSFGKEMDGQRILAKEQ